jgi:hypothetical protein
VTKYYNDLIISLFFVIRVVEALRLNHDRYAVIYDKKYDSNDSGSTTAVVEVYRILPPLLLPTPNPIKTTITVNIMKAL